VVHEKHYFRLVITTALAALSIVLIVQAYINWKRNPVLTSVSTTSLPIAEVPFPAITICGLGTIKEQSQEAYFRQIAAYLVDKRLAEVHKYCSISKITNATIKI
jgi:hypothetical protein